MQHSLSVPAVGVFLKKVFVSIAPTRPHSVRATQFRRRATRRELAAEDGCATQTADARPRPLIPTRRRDGLSTSSSSHPCAPGLKGRQTSDRFQNMSRNAIQQVVQELNLLPESDQQLVLNFLRTLQRNHDAAPTVPVPRRGHNPALKSINNSLVFTGEI